MSVCCEHRREGEFNEMEILASEDVEVEVFVTEVAEEGWGTNEEERGTNEEGTHIATLVILNDDEEVREEEDVAEGKEEIASGEVVNVEITEDADLLSELTEGVETLAAVVDGEAARDSGLERQEVSGEKVDFNTSSLVGEGEVSTG